MQKTELEHIKERLFSTKKPAEIMNNEIKNSVEKIRQERLGRLKPSLFNDRQNNIPDNAYKKICELSDFISPYVKTFGKEQTILDIQTGLNLLNGYRKYSPTEAKSELKEDSEFGEKTLAALVNALKNYPVGVVKRFIKLGAINNKIWSTKNNKLIDTDNEVKNITDTLHERDY